MLYTDDLLLTNEQTPLKEKAEEVDYWKVMIVDDETEIHEVTRLALEDFVFEGKRLKFLSAFSGAEARQLIETHPDTALILLDVIMEQDDAGLQVIKYIRDERANKLVRIVLRTGQPDDVPEEQVILEYDINDYKAKTELTWPKLFTVVISALRSYRDLVALQQHKIELLHTEQVLRHYQEQLEELVECRTAKLREVNIQLQHEVEERQKFGEALDAERNLLRTLIDNLPDYIYVKDKDSRFVMVNSAVARVTGAVTEANLIGKTDFDFYPTELAQKYFTDEQTIMQSGEPLISQEEPVMNQSTGKMEWLLMTKIPIHGNFGEIIGLVGMSRDITTRKQASEELKKYREQLEQLVTERTTELMVANEQLHQEILDRKQADEALARERSLLRTLIDNVPDHIYVKDKCSCFLVANRAIAKFMNVAMIEELVGKTDFDLYPTDLAEQLYQEEQKIIETGQPLINVEVPYTDRASGQTIWLLTNKIPFQDSYGNIAGLVGIKRDITERKQAEQERLQLLAMQSQLAIAQQIQESLLPAPIPAWTDLEVICYTLAAQEVGGDFYVYRAFDLPIVSKSFVNWHHTGSYAVAVGDVSGKGMPAALLMAVSLASFQSVIEQEFSPHELLTYLDNAIMSYTKTTHQNCALVYLEITPPGRNGSAGLLRVANAGCVFPIIKRIDGTVEWIEVGGMPLGVGLGAKTGYQEVSLDLAAGDLVILTTDGVVEAYNPAKEMFGFARFEQAVKAGPCGDGAAMMAHLQREVTTFMADAILHDDLTMVVVRV